MRYFFIGTDEAGYGPNLGPLSVSASLWSADFPRCDDPLSLLNLRGGACFSQSHRIQICDSKKLYHSGRIFPLERSFFYAFEKGNVQEKTLRLSNRTELSTNPFSFDWLRLVQSLSISPDSEIFYSPPWEQEVAFSLPLTQTDYWQDEFQSDYDDTEQILEGEGISLQKIVNRRIQPQEYNLLVDSLGLKSEVLAQATMHTASALLTPLIADERTEKNIFLCCDKLGGRNRYGDLLARFFPEMMFQIVTESRDVSRYIFPLSNGSVTILFQAKGESNLPSAMASIVSKYVREISMKSFNEYWQRRIPDLEPTAGYPVDAKRFREETQIERQNLGVDDELFWRKK